MTSVPAPAPARRRRLRKVEPQAVAGVMSREVINFGSYWKSTAFSSMVEPTIYLLAFGFGLGAIVKEAAGRDYLDFVGTGIVATAVLFSSVFPAMFGTFVKREFQRTYDAILAAPVDAVELVTAEVLWIALRASVFGMGPLLVAIAFGLDPSAGIVLVPAVAFVTGFGFASFGALVAATLKSIDSFSYVTSTVITPLFLVAGTFFPISELPEWAQVASQLNPLHHCVELVRPAVFGELDAKDLGHVAGLLIFAVGAWWFAVRQTRRRIID